MGKAPKDRKDRLETAASFMGIPITGMLDNEAGCELDEGLPYLAIPVKLSVTSCP